LQRPKTVIAEKSRKIPSWNSFRTTYSIATCIALEGAVVDLRIRTTGMNSAALKFVCSPPGIGAKKSRGNKNSVGITYSTFQERSEARFGTTYIIAVECAVMDLDIGALNGHNSSTLEVVCPSGIGAKTSVTF
jgi:hypothetical protein